MPGMTGNECVAELRKRSEFDNSVVTVMSTSIPEKVAETLKNLGANFTFEKPTKFEEYNYIVQKIFNTVQKQG